MAKASLDRRLVGWRWLLSGTALLLLAAPLLFTLRETAAHLPALGHLHPWQHLEAYRNTLALVIGVVGITLPLGTCLAILLFRTDLPGRGFLLPCLLLALFVPLPVTVSAWQGLLGSDGWLRLSLWESRPGQPWSHGLVPSIWVHAMAGLPWVVWIVGLGLTWVERDLEEDALLRGPVGFVLWHVTLPRARGMILVAVAFLVVQCAGEIAVADMFQFITLAEDVYLQFTLGDRAALSRAVVAALPWVLLLAGALAWSSSRTRLALPPLEEAGAPPLVFPLCSGRFFLAFVVLGALCVLIVLPLVSLGYKLGRLGPEQWSAGEAAHRLLLSLSIHAGEIAWMILLGAATGFLIAFLGLLTAWLVVESQCWTFLLGLVLLLCAALPAPILGISLIEVILWLIQFENLEPLRFLLYEHGPAPVMWAHLVRFLPFAFAASVVFVRLIPREMIEQVRLQGCGPAGEWRHVVWPLTQYPFVVLALLMTALCLGEVGASARVETPGWETFARRLFDRMHYGVDAEVAGFALTFLLELTLIGLLLLVGRWLFK